MRLHSPESAILSAIVFNALIIIALIPLSLKGVTYRPAGAASILRRNLLVYGIGGIVALIPLALRGIKYRPVGAAALLRRNLLIYGLGGVIIPFVGIKAIDVAVLALHLV